MARVYCGTWAGGRIAALKGGRRRWLLERSWMGRQHTVPLPTVHSDAQALAQLALWQLDAAAFLEAHQAKRRRDLEGVTGACIFDGRLLEGLAADMRRRRDRRRRAARAR